jgi:hypothetical protein
MKTNQLLFLASLVVLATSARAAQNQPDSRVIVLPTYEVSAPRFLPAEKKVNASLEALREQAQRPAILAAEITVLKDLAMQSGELERAARDIQAVRLAKL